MIHATPFHPGDQRIRSGMRHNTNYAIYIGWERLLRDGYPIYISQNDVIQTSGQDGVIPVKYLFKVVSIRDKQEWINPMYSLGTTSEITMYDLNQDWLQGTHRTIHDYATPEPLGRSYPGHVLTRPDPPQLAQDWLAGKLRRAPVPTV